MKKALLFTTFIMVVMTLAACVSDTTQVNEEPPVDTRGEKSGEGNRLDFSGGKLPAATQLLIGTLEFEGTELEVNAEQASDLLPLWQVYRSLVTSDTAANAEITAVVNQIHETMTQAQLEQIAAMEIAPGRIFTLIQDIGLMPEGFSTDGERPEGLPGEFFRGGGIPGAGGPGSDFGGGAFGQNIDPEQRATLQAQRQGEGASGNRMSLMLIDPLIELLKARAGSS